MSGSIEHSSAYYKISLDVDTFTLTLNLNLGVSSSSHQARIGRDVGLVEKPLAAAIGGKSANHTARPLARLKCHDEIPVQGRG